MKIRRFALTLLSIYLLVCSCFFNKIQTHESVEGSTIAIIKNVYIDEAFSEHEERDIYKALLAWQVASSNRIKFNYSFRHYEPGELEDFYNKKMFNNSLFIWRINSTSLSWYMKNKLERYCGVFDRIGNIIIFVDKINNIDSTFFNVTKHEIGHALGLKHSFTNKRSTMKPASSDISDCISSEDTDKLCSIYYCKGNPECN